MYFVIYKKSLQDEELDWERHVILKAEDVYDAAKRIDPDDEGTLEEEDDEWLLKMEEIIYSLEQWPFEDLSDREAECPTCHEIVPILIDRNGVRVYEYHTRSDTFSDCERGWTPVG